MMVTDIAGGRPIGT